MPIEIKSWLREFLQKKVDEDKRKAGLYKTAGGFTMRESDLEKFLDEMWMYINKRNQDHGKTSQ